MANEKFNENIKLDEIISKVGGDNEQQTVALKKVVRDYLGYSNYVNKMNKMPGVDDPGMKKVMGGGVEESYLHGNITPGGVRQLTGAGMNLRNQEMSDLQRLAKGAESVSKKSSKEAEKSVYSDTMNKIETGEYPDAATKDYLNNPMNEDGTFKSLDQFKQSLTEQLKSGEYGAMTEEEATKLAQDTLDKNISQDVQENLQKYYYLNLGYTETEADNVVKYDRYARGDMSDSEAELYKVTDPTFAAKAEVLKNNPGIQSELDKIKTNEGSALTFKELQSKYPNITAEEVKPYYETAALEDISAILQEKHIQVIDESGQEIPLESVLDAPEVKSMKEALSVIYQGALSSAELDYQIYQYYINNLNKAQ
jgi:hypothetical protein